MRRMTYALALLSSLALVSPALGADAFVVETTPGVLVNAGVGYTPANTLREVRVGQQVMANETGSGWIVYCGCDVEIRPGKVYTVEPRDCPVESVNLTSPGLPHATMIKPLEEEEITRCRAVGAAWLLVPAAAAGICAVAGCFDDDDDPKRRKRPVSP